MLSDLRESGSIEQDSSLVMFLYREFVYNTQADPTDAELIAYSGVFVHPVRSFRTPRAETLIA